jgi:hypothetical protein
MASLPSSLLLLPLSSAGEVRGPPVAVRGTMAAILRVVSHAATSTTCPVELVSFSYLWKGTIIAIEGKSTGRITSIPLANVLLLAPLSHRSAAAPFVSDFSRAALPLCVYVCILM